MAKFRSCTCPRKKKSKSKSKSKKMKCYKSGIVTRNPFLNFLRKFRRENCGKSILQIARDGAKKWNSMTDGDRCTFKQQAWKIPKCRPPIRRRRPKSRLRSRNRSAKRFRSCVCKGHGSRRSSRAGRSRSRSSKRSGRSRSRSSKRSGRSRSRSSRRAGRSRSRSSKRSERRSRSRSSHRAEMKSKSMKKCL